MTGNRREVQPAAAGDEEAVRREREVEERHGCVWRERDARRGCEVAAGIAYRGRNRITFSDFEGSFIFLKV